MQHVKLEGTIFLLALMLTTRQCRMTGDTDASLLPVHVHEPALQAAARRTEHLKKTHTGKIYYYLFLLKAEHTGRKTFHCNCEEF